MNKYYFLAVGSMAAVYLFLMSYALAAPAPLTKLSDINTAKVELLKMKDSQVFGIVLFTQKGHKVHVTADIRGLKPNQKQAIHIHEYGDCSSPDAMSAGEHYNPENKPHALPEVKNRHAGDLGNLVADNEGNAKLDLILTNISLAGKKNPILGRAVIIHSQIDDGSQPSGNAGERLACGIIGVANVSGINP